MNPEPQRERWLVTGASGQLGGHVLTRLSARMPAEQIVALAGRGDVSVLGVSVQRIDLGELTALHDLVLDLHPTHVLHIGAMTGVADCYADPQRAERINVQATQVLAEAAGDVGARFAFTSTDMVFDGDHAPYREEDPPAPISRYGRSKADAEARLANSPHALTVRIPLMFGLPRTKRETTFSRQMQALREGQALKLFTDEYRTPISLIDAAEVLIVLARSELTGIIHVAGPERLSRYELIERCAKLLGIDNAKLEPVSRNSIEAAEPRPADLSLDGTRVAKMFPDAAPKPISRDMLLPPQT